MGEVTLNQIDILMVDPDRNSQSVLKSVLGSTGFKNLRFGRSLSEARRMITDMQPDLLICESDLPDGDFCEFVYSLRHNEIGSNPFLAIIALTRNPSPETVGRLSECGVDHLVVKPFSTAQMMSRIKHLAEAHKLFVVTSDYIGPDRRHRADREGEEVTRIAVPNTIKVKVSGHSDADAIQRVIDLTIQKVNVQKLERYDDEIGFLIERIVPELRKGGMDGTVKQFVDRLLFVVGDTGRRLVGTKYAHVSELCEALYTVTNAIASARGTPDARDIQLLRPLSQAVRVGFGTSPETIAAAREISAEALARFRKAQAEKTGGDMPEAAPRVKSEGPAEHIQKPAATAPTPAPTAAPAPAPAPATPSPPTAGGSFEEVFIESLCAYIRARLEPWHMTLDGPDALPFVFSPVFADRIDDVIRKYVGHAIPRNRRMVVLAQNIDPARITPAYFDEMFAEPNKNANVARFLWNAWWDDIKGALSGASTSGAADAKKVWAHLQQADGAYDPPRIDDIAFFQAMFDYEPTDIRGILTGTQQVLAQEDAGEAQDGASRNFILTRIEDQEPFLGELAALWAYYTRPDFTPDIQKSLVASVGRTGRERRRALPFYLRWAADPLRRPAED